MSGETKRDILISGIIDDISDYFLEEAGDSKWEEYDPDLDEVRTLLQDTLEGQDKKCNKSEKYVLGILTEEMGEVLQLIGKALRFGIDTPGVKRLDGTIDETKTPRTMLPVELGDIKAALHLTELSNIVDNTTLNISYDTKIRKLTDPFSVDNLGRKLSPISLDSPHVIPKMNSDTIVKAIREITDDEGSSLTVVCPNPDFNGQPNYYITCNGGWTNFRDLDFSDDIFEECFNKALIAYRNMKG